MFEVIVYNKAYKQRWDDFIQISKNGTFLFLRDYMDYHADRFTDCSFLFLKKGNIYAVLPANISEKVLYSHQGLTYGGLVTSNKTCITDVLQIFEQLSDKLKELGIKKVIYKPVPCIYHKLPAEEDIYALFRINAKKIGCALSTTVYQNSKINFSELRKRGIKKAQKENLFTCNSTDFEQFIQLLNDNLKKKYNTTAMHSLSEIKHLHSLFQDNIKLYTVEKSGEILAGVILYFMSNVVHVQYIVTSDKGKQIGALDFLINDLINHIYAHIPIFDFGISTEQMGSYLNENLIFQKEGFGGRGICYDTYEINI